MDINKLLAKLTQSSPEQEKEKLDAFLSSRLQKDPNSTSNEGEIQVQPKKDLKDTLKANLLRARQEASETPIGKLIGVSPMSEEEQQFYTQNTDPQLEEDLRRGMQLGLGFGGVRSPIATSLKEIAHKAAPATQQAIKSSSELAEMLKQRNLERLESAAHRKNLEYADKPSKELGEEIVKIKNKYYDLKK